MENLLEYGLVGLSVGVAFKAVELAVRVVVNKVNGRKEEKENGEVLRKLSVIEKSVTRLERVVIDGNGGQPRMVRMAVVEEKVEGHVGDKGLHTAE